MTNWLASNNGVGHGSFHSVALHADFLRDGQRGGRHGHLGHRGSVHRDLYRASLDTTNYLSIGGGGTETITFVRTKMSLDCIGARSIPINTINFYDGTKLVASYTGANVAPLFSDGNQGSFSSNGYVEFSGVAPFNKVVLAIDLERFRDRQYFCRDLIQPHASSARRSRERSAVHDPDIGDTLTASVTGNGIIEYNGATVQPICPTAPMFRR